MATTALALVGLVVAILTPLAAAQSSPETWSLTGLTAQSVPAIWMRDDNDFVRRTPPDGEGFLEIQGRLSVQPGGRLDPVALPEIRARISGSTPGAKPQSAVAVGVSIAMCRYLSPETRVREVSRMAVGKDGGLGVSRDSASAPLKLTLEGPTVDLCIAFAGPARAGDIVSLEFGGRAFTVSLPEPPKPVVSFAKTDAEKGLDFGLPSARTAALVGLSLLVLGVGAFAFWRWRARRASVPAKPAESSGEPERESDAAAEHAAAPEGSGAELAEPGRVCPEHCRTSFVRVGTNVGAGKTDFEAALRVLQAEQFAEADALLDAAITKGLPATFECGAWSLRGQAAVSRGEIPLAITYFLKALAGPEVTSQAALPAAMHLAVIYDGLGLRADAQRMEAVAKTVNSAGITLDPEAIKRMQRHTQAYRKALRAARPTGLNALLGRVFHRPRATSAP